MAKWMVHLGRWTPVPLTVLLLMLPSLCYRVALFDGPETEWYGTPLPWNARGIVTSLSKEIYLLPLTIDFAALGTLAWVLVRLWDRRMRHVSALMNKTLAVGIWLIAVPVTLYMIFALTVFETFYGVWYADITRITAISFSAAF